jgi:hypothetical protein
MLLLELRALFVQTSCSLHHFVLALRRRKNFTPKKQEKKEKKLQFYIFYLLRFLHGLQKHTRLGNKPGINFSVNEMFMRYPRPHVKSS